MEQIRTAVITISDSSYKGEREDKAGPLLLELISPLCIVVKTLLLPDEREIIAQSLKEISDSGEVDLILTSGGTGLSPRDVTPEATLDVLERLVPGIPEAMRSYGLQFTNRAMLSRAVAGTRKRTLIVNMPGSPAALKENTSQLLPVLEHAISVLKGEVSACARPHEP